MLARYGSLAVLLLLVVTASFLAGSFEAGEWYYQKLTRPAWTPPGGFIGVAWAALYLLMALAAWQVWLSGHPARLGALTWWLVLLALLVGWSALFFGLNRIGWAWLELGVTIGIAVFCIRAFYPLSRQGAFLMVPTLMWLLFTWVLNLSMWTMNGGLFGRLIF
jgi:benzodiazapine receptor